MGSGKGYNKRKNLKLKDIKNGVNIVGSRFRDAFTEMFTTGWYERTTGLKEEDYPHFFKEIKKLRGRGGKATLHDKSIQDLNKILVYHPDAFLKLCYAIMSNDLSHQDSIDVSNHNELSTSILYRLVKNDSSKTYEEHLASAWGELVEVKREIILSGEMTGVDFRKINLDKINKLFVYNHLKLIAPTFDNFIPETSHNEELILECPLIINPPQADIWSVPNTSISLSGAARQTYEEKINPSANDITRIDKYYNENVINIVDYLKREHVREVLDPIFKQERNQLYNNSQEKINKQLETNDYIF